VKDLLIIMARYPTLGRVKTRLARDIGKAGALRVYRRLLDHHRREFRRAPFAVEWRYTPARAAFGKLVRNARPQPAGSLGERMAEIFSASFAQGYRRVVMIGTDAPEMRQPTVRQAFESLENHAAVFQPTEDGGYALIGLATMLDVFTGIAWSTDRVMAQTRQRLRRFQIGFAELPVTFDIDTAADLARLTEVTGYGKSGLAGKQHRGR
jgi:rSAM/selenodomain-associated transferase 1